MPEIHRPDIHLPDIQLPDPPALREHLNGLTDSALNWLGNLDDAMASQVRTLLGQPLQQWFQTRFFALWPWILQHPLVAVLLLILGLVILLNLLQWLLNPRTWLAILSFPVRLVARWVTPKPKETPPKAKPSISNSTRSTPRSTSNSIPSPVRATPAQTALTVEAVDLGSDNLGNQEKVQQILSRLKVLQAEQQQLHQQLESLLESKSKIG